MFFTITNRLLTYDVPNTNWTSAPTILEEMQVVTYIAVATNAATVTDTNVRTILLDFQAGNPLSSGTFVNATCPL